MRDFDRLYREELEPLLRDFETIRLAVRGKILRAIGFVGLGIVALLLLALVLGLPTLMVWIGAAAFILGGVVWTQADIKRYRSGFKREVVGRVVSAIDPGLVFRPESCIGQSEYMKSRIFLKRPDRYCGEDLVEGKLGQTAVRFSEIKSEYKSETRDNDGRRRTQWHTIFDGIFFVADFNKEFRQDTVVLPDRAERLFGRIGKFFQEMSFREEDLVTLEDPEFEKMFAVYADDETEARYILTPSLMQRLKDFRAKSGSVYLSFTRSNVNVAVPMKRDLFEPRIMRTILDRSLVEEYLSDLDFFAGIVEDLNLNTRIWTKV